MDKKFIFSKRLNEFQWDFQGKCHKKPGGASALIKYIRRHIFVKLNPTPPAFLRLKISAGMSFVLSCVYVLVYVFGGAVI